MVSVSFGSCSHVLFVVCSFSEELGLDDVMDIELDFPTLSDSQNATAPLTTHSLLEVSLIRSLLFSRVVAHLKLKQKQTHMVVPTGEAVDIGLGYNSIKNP